MAKTKTPKKPSKKLLKKQLRDVGEDLAAAQQKVERLTKKLRTVKKAKPAERAKPAKSAKTAKPTKTAKTAKTVKTSPPAEVVVADSAATSGARRVDDSWTAVELRSEARARGLTGYSRKSKAELIALLQA